MKPHSILFFILALILLISNDILAQCPNNSRPGVHVVQSGETAYRIARNYNISIEQLLTLNNMSYNDRLSRCQELIVSRTTNRNSNGNTSRNTNSITTTPSSYNRPSTTSPSSSNFRVDKSRRQSGNRHTVRSGENMANLAQLYGYTEERFREFNAMNFGEQPTPGSILYSSDCSCDRLSFNTDPNVDRIGTIGDGLGNSRNATSGNSGSNPIGSSPSSSSENTESPAPSTTAGSNTSMNSDELSMIDEINLMRGNPSGYVRIVRDFVASERARGGFPINQSIVEELVRELQASPKLSILKPSECIYKVAIAHANDQRPLGDINHEGRDGSWPWDRIKKGCSDMANGNENLVAGMSTVRGSVITLLIDEGIPNRGHRKTLMNAEWTHAGCHNAGKIGMFPNYWVQKFGAAK